MTTPEPPSGARAATIARGSTYAFLGLGGGAVLQFVYNVVMARAYGAAGVGAFAFGLSIATIAATVGQLGTQEALLRYGAAYRGTADVRLQRGLLGLGFGVGIAGAALAGVVLGLSSDWIARLAGKPEAAAMLLAFAVSVPFMGIIRLASASLQGAKRLDLSSLMSEVGRPVAVLVALCVGIALTLSIDKVMAVYVVATAGVALGGLAAVAHVYRAAMRTDPAYSAREWARFVGPVMLLDLFRSSTAWTDTLLLGFTASSEEVGVYFAALRVALVITLPLAAFNAVLAPIAAELWHKQDVNGLRSAFRTATRWTLTAVLPLGVLAAILRDEIMSVFGAEFAAAGGGLVLLLLIVGRVVNGATGGVGRLLIMTGNERVELVNTVIWSALVVTLMLLVVPRYGMVGAALVTGGVIAFMNVLKLIQVRWIVGIQPYDWTYLKPLAAAAASALVGMAADVGLASTPSVGRAVAVSLLVAATYIGTLWTLRLDDDDRMILDLLRKRLGR